MARPIARIYNWINDRNAGINILAQRNDDELNQIIATVNGIFVAQASAPSSPTVGDGWIDTTNSVVKVYFAGGWCELPTITSPAQGNIVYYNGTHWVKLTPGTSGQYLMTQGASANPVWNDVLQKVVQEVYHQRQDSVQCGTIIPYNNGPRTSLEGNLILTQTITPTSNSNVIKIQVSINYSNNGASQTTIILMNGTTVLATSRASYMAGGGSTNPPTLTYYLTSPGTSAITINVNAGDEYGYGSTNIGLNGAATDGGKMCSTLTVTEMSL